LLRRPLELNPHPIAGIFGDKRKKRERGNVGLD